jgi:hypothetical protein
MKDWLDADKKGDVNAKIQNYCLPRFVAGDLLLCLAFKKRL